MIVLAIIWGGSMAVVSARIFEYHRRSGTAIPLAPFLIFNALSPFLLLGCLIVAIARMDK